jgi:urease accessory protein
MSDWLTWQVVDSAFPTGAFAHSWGLESAWQHGEIDGPAALRRFLDASAQQAGHAVMPLMSTVYDDPDRLEAIDDLTEAFLLNVVVNRASRVQGRALSATALQVWPSPALDAVARRVEETCGHVAPVSGAVFRTIGVSRQTAQRALLFGTARGVLSAAVRLGIIGGYEAQRLQHASAAWLERVAVECAELTADDVAQTAPVLDLLQAGHDRLYSRLFQS